MEEREIVIATSHNAALNLAGEKLLMEEREKKRILYLWENDPCVVIGRNQNPLEECDLPAMERDGVLLVRRESGGGAVYHDRGNICFTLIGERRETDRGENFAFLRSVLLTLGVPSTLSGRNDILVGGRKVSGSAFLSTRERFCHHGTLLVSSDPTRLERYLTPSREKLESHAVVSVASRVGSLRETVPSLTNEEVKSAFVSLFRRRWGDAGLVEKDWGEDERARKIAGEFSDRSLILARTPPFSWKGRHRFPWGEVSVALTVREGVITEATIFSDCLDATLPPLWRKKLTGLPLARAAFRGEGEGEETGDLWNFLRQSLQL